MNAQELLRQAKGFILDSDGTLQDKGKPITGAKECLRIIEKQGKRFVILTNASMKTPQKVADELWGMDLQVPPENIITSNMAAAEVVASLGQERRAYVLGCDAVRKALSERGVTIVEKNAWKDREWDPHQVPNVVVLGKLLMYGMEDIDPAVKAIRKYNAAFVATNDDRFTIGNSNEDFHTGAGFAVHGLTHATGRKPIIAGKPYTTATNMALARLKLPPEHVIAVGDNLETDMEMVALYRRQSGQRFLSCLVRSGMKKSEEEVDRYAHEDHCTVQDVGEIERILQRG
ncbi:MAG: HAD family hydrolase [Candidatus Peregrinibacteria bacterium]|nr:HAD family hydrolase [Candidatus Peregrinibacteria bacterium]